MIRVLLSHADVFPRRVHAGLSWRGVSPGAEVLSSLAGVDPSSAHAPEIWTARLAAIPSPFGAVLVRDDAVLAAVDRARSFPLFRAETDGGLWLGDDARRIGEEGGAEPGRDPVAEAEARLTGFVTGEGTLHPQVRQLRSGDVLHATMSGGRLSVRIAAAPLPPWGGARAADAAVDHLAEMLRALIARVLGSMDGRQLVLPLTGGYDSRLLALLVREAGYDRVLCLGSHRANDREAVTGREVARRLGFDWAPFGVEPAQWRAWYASAERRRYYRAADGLAALPSLLEWPSAMELRRSRRADDDAVFVPGHFGHFVTGSSTPDRHRASPRGLADHLARRRWVLNPWPRDRALADAVRARLEASAVDAARDAADLDDAVDRWEWREHQTKRDGAGVLAIGFAGFEWRVPFADPEVLAFWRAAPRRARVDSRLHHELVRRMGRRWGLPPANPGVDRARRLRRWARRAGLMAPARGLRRLARRLDGRGIARGDAPGWSALFDPREVRRTYTGLEGVESYLVRDWLADPGGTDLL